MKKHFFFLLIMLIGCSTNYITINNEHIQVEIAKSPIQKQKGLMHRESLCQDCGMLFIFNRDANQTFWMKSTLIPLDMIFINSDFIVVDIIRANPCTQDQCKTYYSEHPAKYVLETNQGRFSQAIIGQKVKLKS